MRTLSSLQRRKVGDGIRDAPWDAATTSAAS